MNILFIELGITTSRLNYDYEELQMNFLQNRDGSTGDPIVDGRNCKEVIPHGLQIGPAFQNVNSARVIPSLHGGREEDVGPCQLQT